MTGFMFSKVGLCLFAEFVLQMKDEPLGHEELVDLFNAHYVDFNYQLKKYKYDYFDTVAHVIANNNLQSNWEVV